MAIGLSFFLLDGTLNMLKHMSSLPRNRGDGIKFPKYSVQRKITIAPNKISKAKQGVN
tara:strand:+ start:67 stop:240 length:174 start_codon:yes stop_codon:yes gene_type:complete